MAGVLGHGKLGRRWCFVFVPQCPRHDQPLGRDMGCDSGPELCGGGLVRCIGYTIESSMLPDMSFVRPHGEGSWPEGSLEYCHLSRERRDVGCTQ